MTDNHFLVLPAGIVPERVLYFMTIIIFTFNYNIYINYHG